jgi:hypothetical protein
MNNMEKEPKRSVYLYLPESQAKKLEALKEGDLENFIFEYIQQSKRELSIQLDEMDEDIIQYKAAMIDARKKFKAAKEEMLEANWAMWEEFDEQKKSIRSKAEEVVEELKPLTEELTKIGNLMNNVKKWEIENFLDMLDKIKYHLHGDNKNIIEFLVKNYKRNE